MGLLILSPQIILWHQFVRSKEDNQAT